MKSIKKLLCAFLTMLLLVSAITPVMADNNIKVRLGGELIKFDVQPQLINDRTMVPLRAIFEELGATVEWNSETRTVTSTKDDTTISLTIDNNVMKVNDSEVTLDSPACIVEGRTLVPVRAISEAFGLNVEWVVATKTVKIKIKVAVPIQEKMFDSTVTINHTYDKSGNLIFTDRSDATWTKYSYDENDNMIYYESSDGYWEKSKYNEDNKITERTTNGGYFDKYQYNEKGELIFEESGSGSEVNVWTKYTYDEKGNVISEQRSDGLNWNYTYDENGNEILCQNDDSYWKQSTYDNEGRIISAINSYGDKETYIYDTKGNLIFYETVDGIQTKYTYDSEGFLSETNKIGFGDTHTIKYTVIEK